MKVVTASQMRSADKAASSEYGVPSIVLMENAAISCVKEIEKYQKFVVLCGKGNNGGDGLAIARHLINKGKEVKIYLVLGDNFSGDAKVNYDILEKMSAKFLRDTKDLKTDTELSDCVVDAIFGTGINGEISKEIQSIFDVVNENSKFTLSVDIPSGVCADSGKVFGSNIKADKTVTFGAYKLGLLLYPGADFTGEIKVADISLPRKILENVTKEVITDKLIREIMPKRRKNSQKGDYGKVFVIGGSVGMAGAVCLAAESAFKVGAGIVTACVPNEINDIIQKRVPNAMTYPVDFEKDLEKVIEKINSYDTILFGNGIGRSDFVATLLEAVVKNAKVPVVIDADGLFALAQKPQILSESNADIVITPHSMEMARLVKKDVDMIEKDRVGISEKYVLDNRLTLVLKGNHSIITAHNGKQFINVTGNSGMATAGSGDVLAGMIAGFLAGGVSAEHSAVLGVYLHGLAGDYGAKKNSEASLTSLDIKDSISHILPVEI